MIGLAIRVNDFTQRREKRPRVISEKTAVKETSNKSINSGYYLASRHVKTVWETSGYKRFHQGSCINL